MRLRYSSEYLTPKRQHARYMQRLDLSDIIIVKQIQVFKKYYVYLLKNSLKAKFDKQYKGLYRILEILRNNKVKLTISDKRKKIVNSDKLKKC